MPRASLDARMNAEIKELQRVLLSMNTERLRMLEPTSGVSMATLFRVRQGRTRPSAATIDAIWAGIEVLEEAEREGPSQ